MQTGGYGVTWDIHMEISDAELYQMGQEVPLTAGEAARIFGCSRQNIDDLTRRGKLNPIFLFLIWTSGG
jgi:hypothetical protein